MNRSREMRLADLSIYTLLYLCERSGRPVNLGRSRADPLAVYLKCAAALNRSLSRYGAALTILTNQPERLADLQRCHGTAVAQQAMAFTLAVPETIGFRAAHFKLEAIRHFASGAWGEVVLLLDADVLALSEIRLRLRQLPFLMGYRLDDESRDPQLLRSKALLLNGRAAVCERWWGGEFLLGNPAGFGAISPMIGEIFSRYATHFQRCAHQGDEMMMNAALDVLQSRTPVDPGSLALEESNPAGVISRWWSVRTPEPGPPLKAALRSSLIHLPADKTLLAQVFDEGDPGTQTAKLLQRRLARKTRALRYLRPLLPVLSPTRPRAPRL